MTTAWLLGDDRSYQAWLGRLVVLLARDQQTVSGKFPGFVGGKEAEVGERGLALAGSCKPPASLDDDVQSRLQGNRVGAAGGAAGKRPADGEGGGVSVALGVWGGGVLERGALVLGGYCMGRCRADESTVAGMAWKKVSAIDLGESV